MTSYKNQVIELCPSARCEHGLFTPKIKIKSYLIRDDENRILGESRSSASAWKQALERLSIEFNQ